MARRAFFKPFSVFFILNYFKTDRLRISSRRSKSCGIQYIIQFFLRYRFIIEFPARISFLCKFVKFHKILLYIPSLAQRLHSSIIPIITIPIITNPTAIDFFNPSFSLRKILDNITEPTQYDEIIGAAITALPESA